MFLSRIRLQPAAHLRRDYWETFRSEYRLHQRIWRLFSAGRNDVRRFVYRLDTTHSGEPTVMAVSEDPPENDGKIWLSETKPYHPRLYEGMPLAFQLRANPTVCRDAKRHDVVMDLKHRLRQEGISLPHCDIVQQAGERWLHRQGLRCGFDVDSVCVNGYKLRDHRCKTSHMRYATCDFFGVLTVRDPDALLSTLQQGLGRAKAFGCGLLLAKRA